MGKTFYALIACEESQAICKNFRSLEGWEAYSCDLQECSGGHPEWHIKGDCIPLINGTGHRFVTEDGVVHRVKRWDLIIAHPPCTYLTVSGNRWLNEEKFGDNARKRKQCLEEGAAFFMQFAQCDCDHVAIENPIGVMSTRWRKPDQNIQPWWFGDAVQKTTCLWLKNLPRLTPDVLNKPDIRYKEWTDPNGKKRRQDASLYGMKAGDNDSTRKARSKTFPGVALAMCRQWARYIEGGDPILL